MNSTPKSSNTQSSFLSSSLMSIFIVFVALAAVVGFTFLILAPDLSQPAHFLDGLFAASSQQLMWYITRSAGLTAYLVLWFSVAWGLAVPSKILDNLLHRTFTYDFHEFVSLLAIGFTLVHMVVLLFDRYMPYSPLQILVPFLSDYRPLWIGIGVIAFYLMVLVTVTFYLRSRIGMKAFRSIHMLSLVAYFGVTLHGFFSGTDTPLSSVMVMYVGTFMATIALTFYWLVVLMLNKRRKNAKNSAASMPAAANKRPQPAVIPAAAPERVRRF